MPRRINSRATAIYWLIDRRPETIAKGWSDGCPFYCGKTVYDLEWRLKQHKFSIKRKPDREISKALIRCGDHVSIELIELVPVSESWVQREQHWIAFGRAFYPYMANTVNGGQGALGLVISADTKAKISKANTGKIRSQETRELLRRINLGKAPIVSPESIARRAAKQRGRKASEETRERLRLSHLGKKPSPESIAKGAATRKGHIVTAETRAKISAANTGKPGKSPTAETRAKLRAANLGRKVSEETRERMRLAQQNRKPISEEARAKMRAAKLGKPGRPVGPEERAKRSQSQKGRVVSEKTRELLRLANIGKKQSPEAIEKKAAKHRGMKRPEGTGAKIWASRRANASAQLPPPPY